MKPPCFWVCGESDPLHGANGLGVQSLAEQDGAALLEYKLILEEGPEHDKSFTIAAYINNNEVGRGVAKTKKAAEMEAARVALRLFGVTV